MADIVICQDTTQIWHDSAAIIWQRPPAVMGVRSKESLLIDCQHSDRSIVAQEPAVGARQAVASCQNLKRAYADSMVASSKRRSAAAWTGKHEEAHHQTLC
jgi:hypothetical protein